MNEEEQSKVAGLTQLTREEVNALPDGSEVMILWSGGNGPARYTTQRHYDSVYTLGKRSDGFEYLANLIDFVGPCKPFTQVWLISRSDS